MEVQKASQKTDRQIDRVHRMDINLDPLNYWDFSPCISEFYYKQVVGCLGCEITYIVQLVMMPC